MQTMRRVLAVLAILALAGIADGQTRSSMFVFQNNFWLNLHQFMRGEVYRRGAKLPPGLDPASLGEADRARWTAAVDAYVDVATHNLLDPWSEQTQNTLGGLNDVAVLPDGALEPAVATALNNAAPIYRALLWPARRRDNDAWIASAKALVTRHETAMAATLANAYHVTWPRDPYLVDAVGEIGANSGVTHGGPAGFAARIQAGAASPRNTGDAPLELIFHEASHTLSVGGRISAMIAEESARQKLTVPDELWHFMIMFTTGALARRELANTGRPGYASYDDRYHQIPPAERSAFERDWQPYLDGKAPFEQALHDLVRDARAATVTPR